MRSVAVAAILMAAGLGHANAETGAWQTDPRSACAVWDPLPVPGQTIGWTGDCRAGKASGRGVLEIFRTGKLVERNEGAFVDGRQTGPGSRRNAVGRYTGAFKDGLFDGHGLFVSSDGMRYDGEWKNGNLHGQGTLILASGARYEGGFRVNSFSGYGSLTLLDGSRYDGDYRFNAPHGLGVYRQADGTVYAGEWKQGCFTDGHRTANLGVPAEDCGL